MQSSTAWWRLSAPIQAPALCPLCGGGYCCGIKQGFVKSIVAKGILFHPTCSRSRSRSYRTGSLRVVSKEGSAHSSASSSSSSQQMDVAIPGSGTLAGSVVALGKFEALHIGHRALAEQASRMGQPVLLSFTGMGEILGWEKKLPIVAPADRARVMSLWSRQCGGLTPREFSLEFGKVRHLSPQQFVEKLAMDLKVKGVVAGENYRFGYRAAGDSSKLQKLCQDCGLEVYIVQPVMDKLKEQTGDAKDKGQVSSTRVRKALAHGNMERVRELLGRSYRLIMGLDNAKWQNDQLKVPLSDSCNQFPAPGSYSCTVTTKIAAPDSQSSPGNGAAAQKLSTCEVVFTGEEAVISNMREQNTGFLVIDF